MLRWSDIESTSLLIFDTAFFTGLFLWESRYTSYDTACDSSHYALLGLGLWLLITLPVTWAGIYGAGIHNGWAGIYGPGIYRLDIPFAFGGLALTHLLEAYCVG
jgi:hypothetical protein